MAWRETRASWARLLFFFLCVALGVAAIVVLRSVVAAGAHDADARGAEPGRRRCGGAVASRPWTDESRASLVARCSTRKSCSRRQRSSRRRRWRRRREGRGSGTVKLVELRGVEAAFPFYGALELDGRTTYSHDLLAGHGALVQPELLVELGLEVGDDAADWPAGRSRFAASSRAIACSGRRRHRVRPARLRRSRRSAGDVAPRVRQPRDAIGSLAARRTSRDRCARRGGSARRFGSEPVVVRSWRALEDRLGRNLTIAENYLSLVGFAIVVLGGIGVWSVTRVLVQQKIRSVAILKCLGATSGHVLATYVLQVLALAAGGSAARACGLAAARRGCHSRVGARAARRDRGQRHAGPRRCRAMAVGLLVSLLFALVPLLEVRRVKPLLLLRADTAHDRAPARLAELARGRASRPRRSSLVAMWQAGSLRAGLYVSAGLVGRGAGALCREPAARPRSPRRSRGRRASRCGTRSSASAGRATRRA